MPAPWKLLLRQLGWIDKAFAALFVASFVGSILAPARLGTLFATFLAFVFGILVAFKWTIRGVRKVIWRLRYRLLVAYLFIAAVPLVLMALLVWSGTSVIAGQIAAYFLTSELDRTTAGMLGPARGLVWTPPALRAEHARWLAITLWSRFPGLHIAVRDHGTTWQYPEDSAFAPPPEGWGDSSGLLRKNGRLYLWAHAAQGGADVSIAAPLTRQVLAQLLPNLGDAQFRRGLQRNGPLEEVPDGGAPAGGLPPQNGFFDREVDWLSVIPVAVWDTPGKFEHDKVFLRTRYSAVLGTVFGQATEWTTGETAGSLWWTTFLVVVGILILVYLTSVIIGVRLTRTITRAVHNLYQGTLRIRVGDFSHRIEVNGNDQLAELSQSFNHMTEDLERLVEVAKEKERLQSEIEIAREVQNQLFPKSVPAAKSLELAASCLPARLVSGDYYDYMNLEPPSLALAIGDVAGKGISAALLMATVQSTMRTQLRAGRELATTAGNGSQHTPPSTAALVSRLNQQLFAFTPPEKFATFYFALYDDATGIMTYTNAGHLPPILVRDGDATRLDVTGTVVGAFSFAQYGESSVRLEKGDLLVCFTDGVTEPENEFGEMFGEDRLTELVVKHAKQGSDEIIHAVMDSVRHWTGSPELQDDMTLLLARRV